METLEFRFFCWCKTLLCASFDSHFPLENRAPSSCLINDISNFTVKQKKEKEYDQICITYCHFLSPWPGEVIFFKGVFYIYAQLNLMCLCVTIYAAMQSQLVCNGCRSILLYPRGASNVWCAVCSTVTSVPPPGMHTH